MVTNRELFETLFDSWLCFNRRLDDIVESLAKIDREVLLEDGEDTYFLFAQLQKELCKLLLNYELKIDECADSFNYIPYDERAIRDLLDDKFHEKSKYRTQVISGALPLGTYEALPWLRDKVGDPRAEIKDIQWAGRNSCDLSLWKVTYKPSGIANDRSDKKEEIDEQSTV